MGRSLDFKLAIAILLTGHIAQARAQEFVYRPEGGALLIAPGNEYTLEEALGGDASKLLPPGGEWLGGAPDVFLFSGREGFSENLTDRLPRETIQDTRCRTVCVKDMDNASERKPICFPVCGDALERFGVGEIVR